MVVLNFGCFTEFYSGTDVFIQFFMRFTEFDSLTPVNLRTLYRVESLVMKESELKDRQVFIKVRANDVTKRPGGD